MIETNHLHYYIKAFETFLKEPIRSLRYKSMGNGFYFLWNGNTYRTATFEDLRTEIKTYFERKQYDEIYCQLPVQLWDVVYQDDVSIEPSEFVIDAYLFWDLYWDDKKSEIADEAYYEKRRQKSFEELNIFLQAFKLDPGSLASKGSKLDPFVFIPVIAMVLKGKYDDEAEFYDDCVNALVNECRDLITSGETFFEVDLEGPEGSTIYYIYEPLFNLEKKETKPVKFTI